MIKIAKIVNTHALKGELKLKSFTDFPLERFKVGETLTIKYENNNIQLKIKKVRFQNDLIFIVFEQHEHINLVEKYKGCDVFIDKAKIHSLEEDAYYFHELVGCEVYENQQYIGKVSEVLDYPAQQILVIDDRKKMIPFVHAFVKDVNVKDKKITVTLIEGM